MTHLNLVESDFEKLEKRILPRFPFCYMTFKSSEQGSRVFEVKDISYSGMQLGLKDGSHGVEKDQNIHGNIHWGPREIEVTGNVKWSTDMRLGIEFSTAASFRESMDDFLHVTQLSKHLKPVHKFDHGVYLPVKLKYWLRADGPVEIFVWQHNDSELSKIQVLIMENFVEWEDGKGLKTARILSKRDIDSPLISEDEIVFKIDESIDELKASRAYKLVSGLNEDQIPESVLQFLQLKLRP